MVSTPPDVTFTADADELFVLSVVLRLPNSALPVTVTAEPATFSVAVLFES